MQVEESKEEIAERAPAHHPSFSTSSRPPSTTFSRPPSPPSQDPALQKEKERHEEKNWERCCPRAVTKEEMEAHLLSSLSYATSSQHRSDRDSESGHKVTDNHQDLSDAEIFRRLFEVELIEEVRGKDGKVRRRKLRELNPLSEFALLLWAAFLRSNEIPKPTALRAILNNIFFQVEKISELNRRSWRLRYSTSRQRNSPPPNASGLLLSEMQHCVISGMGEIKYKALSEDPIDIFFVNHGVTEVNCADFALYCSAIYGLAGVEVYQYTDFNFAGDSGHIWLQA